MAESDDKNKDLDNKEKGSDEQHQHKLDNDADKGDEEKIYSAEHVKGLIAERDKAKSKLRSIEEAQEKTNREKEETDLKAKGDYETLAKNLQAQSVAQLTNLKKKTAQLELVKLGTEHGISKSQYLSVFDGNIEVGDDLQISNSDELKKSFTKFKDENKNLFTEGKVPQTDNNSPIKKLNVDSSNLTPQEVLAKATEELIDKSMRK